VTNVARVIVAGVSKAFRAEWTSRFSGSCACPNPPRNALKLRDAVGRRIQCSVFRSVSNGWLRYRHAAINVDHVAAQPFPNLHRRCYSGQRSGWRRWVTRNFADRSREARTTRTGAKRDRAPPLRDAIRLLNLVGPPGAGKTRLALTAAAELITAFRGGAVFVDLTVARNSDHVGSVIATALGVRETSDEDIVDRLKALLREFRGGWPDAAGPTRQRRRQRLSDR
jgi:hypothetical protein